MSEEANARLVVVTKQGKFMLRITPAEMPPLVAALDRNGIRWSYQEPTRDPAAGGWAVQHSGMPRVAAATAR